MWLGEKTAGSTEAEPCCRIGEITSGGAKPMVETQGEAREARLLTCGAVYVPKAGDEVLTAESAEGQCFILGTSGTELPKKTEKGELVLTNGSKGLIRLKADGTIELSGSIKLAGDTEITGSLIINGEHYMQPASGGDGTGGTVTGGGDGGA